MSQLLDKAKKTKIKKVREFNEALTKIQEKDARLSQQLLQTASNIQNLNSQATAISGSASASHRLGARKRRDWYSGRYSTEPVPFEIEKCNECGKQLLTLDDSITIDDGFDSKICPECQKKLSLNRNK